jgi:hypothetical protein
MGMGLSLFWLEWKFRFELTGWMKCQSNVKVYIGNGCLGVGVDGGRLDFVLFTTTKLFVITKCCLGLIYGGLR